MKYLAQDFIKFLFEKNYKLFSKKSIEIITNAIKNSSEIEYKIVAVLQPYWFEYEEEYLEEEDFPIEGEIRVKDDSGNQYKGSVYLFLDLETGELSDEIEFIPDELEKV